MRSSGILMHITSLPSPYGIGTLGSAAYRFVDFLHQAGQHYWQILPVGPTGTVIPRTRPSAPMRAITILSISTCWWKKGCCGKVRSRR